MNRRELTELIIKKRSYLCVGLDPDPDRLPLSIKASFDDPVFEFNKRIIDATIDYAVAYKPNVAFYEAGGSKGWQSLERTAEYIAAHPKGPVFSIADAKRADIGNSSAAYARAFLHNMPFDAVTVNPYMGKDSVEPFLNVAGKWAIILALTSNPGASDFQLLQPQFPMFLEKFGIKTDYWKKLYELVLEQSLRWGSADNTMFVVGATQSDLLQSLRQLVPDHFFLIPGVGAQGGSLADISKVAMNDSVGILVNSSRQIIFASTGKDFDEAARKTAAGIQQEMSHLLTEKQITI